MAYEVAKQIIQNSTAQFRTEHYNTAHYITTQNKTQNNTIHHKPLSMQMSCIQNKTVHYKSEHDKTTQNKTFLKEGVKMEEKAGVIQLKPIKINYATITIEGDGDIYLSKMSDPAARLLVDERNSKAKDVTAGKNKWEEIITSLHWLNGKPNTFTEKSLKDNLNPKKNAPCISAFGLKKSFGDAVVRNEIATYSTKFHNSVNIIATGGLIPITFAEHYIDEKLMSPVKGKLILARLNRFSGWKAQFMIQYTDTVYSLEQILNIINLAGFGLGIGSGRSSGYGRYHVVNVE